MRIKRFDEMITENYLSNQDDIIIDKIIKELINHYYADFEIEENNYDYTKLWGQYVERQEMGDCQLICSIIRDMNIKEVNTYFGEIKVEEPSYLGRKKNYYFTHHWATINNTIYEFSKGTLKDHIDWDDIYSVDCEGISKYKIINKKS